MDAVWFWLLIVFLLFAIFAWPMWPYTRDRGIYRRRGRWRYAPSAVALAAIFLLLILFWLGFLAILWPWSPYPVV